MKNPLLRLWVGPMFSSKTTQLIAAIDRLRIKRKKVLSFKPRLDDRYSMQGEIVTHNGGTTPCLLVSTGEDILNAIGRDHDIDTVAIDEAFMIAGCDDAILKLMSMGINILVSSIELSSENRPFSTIKNIMPYATEVNKCAAVCSECEEDAYYTFKKNTLTGKEIEVGGSELYEPRCWLHHDKTKSTT